MKREIIVSILYKKWNRAMFRNSIIFILSSLAFNSSAQSWLCKFSVSPVFSYNRYMGEVQKNATGIQLRIGYDLAKRATVFIGAEHGFLTKTDTASEYKEIMPRFDPPGKGILLAYHWRSDKLNTGVQFRIIDKVNFPIKLYLSAAMGYLKPGINEVTLANSAPIKLTTSGFSNPNASPVFPVFREGYQGNHFVITGEAGLGLSYSLNRFSLFVEGNLSAPLSKHAVNGKFDSSALPNYEDYFNARFNTVPGSVDPKYYNYVYADAYYLLSYSNYTYTRRVQSFPIAENFPKLLNFSIGCKIKFWK
jgi:hypothetical protein